VATVGSGRDAARVGAPFWTAAVAALVVTFVAVWVFGRFAVAPVIAIGWLFVALWVTCRGTGRQRMLAWIVLAAVGLVLVVGVVLTG